MPVNIYQRHPNPIVSFWHFHKNLFKMWRIKINTTLISLLVLLGLTFGYLMYLAGGAEFERSGSLLKAFLVLPLTIGIIGVIVFIDFIMYLIVCRVSSVYKLRGLKILDSGIEFEFADSKKYIQLDNIKKMDYLPYRAIAASVPVLPYWARAGASFMKYFEIQFNDETGGSQTIDIPLDIANVKEALEIISSKLDNEMVKINFQPGKPTTSYIPGVSSPDIASKPIGKWVLLFFVLFILFIWIITKLFL